MLVSGLCVVILWCPAAWTVVRRAAAVYPEKFTLTVGGSDEQSGCWWMEDSWKFDRSSLSGINIVFTLALQDCLRAGGDLLGNNDGVRWCNVIKSLILHFSPQSLLHLSNPELTCEEEDSTRYHLIIWWPLQAVETENLDFKSKLWPRHHVNPGSVFKLSIKYPLRSYSKKLF